MVPGGPREVLLALRTLLVIVPTLFQKHTHFETRVPDPWGGYSLVMGYWGCAAGWGRIFTTRLTITGSPFQAFSIELLEWGSTFSGL